MNKAVKFIVLIALFVSMSFNKTIVDCDDPIKLKFKENSKTFDPIVAGTKLEFKYEFVVTSCDSIRIRQVYTGCNCTSPSYSDKLLAPGEKGYINLVFDSEEWGADTGRLVEKQVYIMYTGGSQDIYFRGVVYSRK
jgi:uncharacterized lipoprotein YehR (DUF1307 family)